MQQDILGTRITVKQKTRFDAVKIQYVTRGQYSISRSPSTTFASLPGGRATGSLVAPNNV